MKKNKHPAIILALAVLLSVALSSCGKQYSEGLEFESNGDGTCTWIGLGSCEDTEIMVPEKNGEDTVTAVGANVLNRKEGITKVVLPDTVKTIKENAFMSNDDLLEIDFGSGLETIEKFGVAYCDKLEKLDLPDSVRTIGEHAFTGDTALLEILIPEGVESVGDFAFTDTTSVKKISIPASMNEFEAYSFCTTSLEEIEFKGENKYFYLYQTDAEEGSDQAICVRGSLCQDYQSTERSNSYDELSEASYPPILCAMLGKDTIILNGEEVAMTTELETGAYVYEGSTLQGSVYEFEIAENQELVIRFGEELEIARIKYEVNEGTKEMTVKGTSTIEGQTLNIEGAFIPLADKFVGYIAIASPAVPDDVAVFEGIWSKA